MIPPSFDPSNPSDGERVLFDAFRTDPMTDGWTVLHSLDLPRHVKQHTGEIDFVVIVPNLGVVCCEVKGHRKIVRKDGAWYLGANPAPDYRGPFKQASTGMHSLMKRVREALPTQRDTVFSWAVITPFVARLTDGEPVEWEAWQLVTRTDLQRASVGAAMVKAIQGEIARLPNGRADAKFPPRQADALAKFLRPDFEVLMSPEERRIERTAELRRFTEEQFTALELMAANPQTIFEGPAGTGKTVLAIEEARRAAATGRRVLFLCYNAWLRSHVQHEFRGNENVVVQSLSGLYLEIVGHQGDKGDRSGDWWDGKLRDAAIDVLLESGPTMEIDLLVIDEAQDLLGRGGLEVVDLLADDLLRTGNWRMFADFERQAIFGDPTAALETLRATAPRAVHFPLVKNCRNTPRIVDFIEMATGMHPGYREVLRRDDGVQPTPHYYKNHRAQVALLEQEVRTLIDEGFKCGDIAILSPIRHGVARDLSSEFGDMLSSDPTHLDEDRIIMATIQKFKGLDRPAVILTDIDDVSTPTAEALFYTGMTRATDRLVVLISRDQRPRIQTKLAEFATRRAGRL